MTGPPMRRFRRHRRGNDSIVRFSRQTGKRRLLVRFGECVPGQQQVGVQPLFQHELHGIYRQIIDRFHVFPQIEFEGAFFPGEKYLHYLLYLLTGNIFNSLGIYLEGIDQNSAEPFPAPLLFL